MDPGVPGVPFFPVTVPQFQSRFPTVPHICKNRDWNWGIPVTVPHSSPPGPAPSLPCEACLMARAAARAPAVRRARGAPRHRAGREVGMRLARAQRRHALVPHRARVRPQRRMRVLHAGRLPAVHVGAAPPSGARGAGARGAGRICGRSPRPRRCSRAPDVAGMRVPASSSRTLPLAHTGSESESVHVHVSSHVSAVQVSQLTCTRSGAVPY